MTKLKSVFILFAIITNFSFASTTVIKGNVKDFDNQEITLFAYTDYITNAKKTLGYTTISANGTFSFEYDCEYTQKVFLKIEDKTTWFYNEPGKVYNISLSYDEEFNKQRVYDKQLSLKFNFPAPTELNQEIKKFNTKYDAFFDENYVLFVKRDRSVEPKIKAFKTKTLKEVETVKSEFVKNYITYTIAALESSIDVDYSDRKTGKNSTNTKANIYLEYLHNQPVLYHHSEYMNFFKSFFKTEMKDLTLKVNGIDITKAINEEVSTSSLSKALSKYPFLENEEFKGLFTLYGLFRIRNDKYFNKDNIIQLISDIKKNSSYPEQKIIASNIYTILTQKKLEQGSKAPDFKLMDKDSNLVSLNSFEGRPIYINFWATWNIPSQKEMKVMKVLHQKYGEQIQFVSICTDNNFEKMSSFLAKNQDYNWSFLHLGKNQHLLEKYKVATIPSYFLLDKNLKIVKAPAGRPGGTAERATEDNIEKDFYDLINNH